MAAAKSSINLIQTNGFCSLRVNAKVVTETINWPRDFMPEMLEQSQLQGTGDLEEVALNDTHNPVLVAYCGMTTFVEYQDLTAQFIIHQVHKLRHSSQSLR